jgi:hypothetical protein
MARPKKTSAKKEIKFSEVKPRIKIIEEKKPEKEEEKIEESKLEEEVEETTREFRAEGTRLIEQNLPQAQPTEQRAQRGEERKEPEIVQYWQTPNRQQTEEDRMRGYEQNQGERRVVSSEVERPRLRGMQGSESEFEPLLGRSASPPVTANQNHPGQGEERQYEYRSTIGQGKRKTDRY